MEEFIKHFSEQFDDTDMDEFTPELVFHDLEEWSSIVGLAILNMMIQKYKVRLSPGELANAVTVRDVWEIVQEKVEKGQKEIL